MSYKAVSIKVRTLTGLSLLSIALMLASCAGNAGSPARQAANHKPTGSNSSVQAQPTAAGFLSKPVVYVALGASDAVGVGSNVPVSQGYVPLVAAHLPKGSHALDLGISGIQLRDALTAELPLALSTSPDLITVWLVANDFIGGVTYDDYMQNLGTLLSQLRGRTHARIFMADLPDLTRLPAFAGDTAAQKAQMLQEIQRWNAGIAQQAARYGVTLVDLFSHGSEITAHPEYISGDGFHPSPAGYARLANLFWQAIQA
ncbi:MAG TPA: GDSL-type esterase/lipase family protein [Ktedonobacteraceae bacterium]|nr:GDSL-type esterase/lipase family protein [Ktedonobacteraceae bacterium]